MIKVKKMDTVTVHYKGHLTDGTMFDETPADKPLMFIVGKEEVIPGFEEAVEGMFKGETKKVTIPCDKAYGDTEPEMIEDVKLSDLPDDLELVEGKQLEVTQDDGSVFYVMVTDLTDTHVTLDANHPLAGKELIFDIELIEVAKEPTA